MTPNDREDIARAIRERLACADVRVDKCGVIVRTNNRVVVHNEDTHFAASRCFSVFHFHDMSLPAELKL